MAPPTRKRKAPQSSSDKSLQSTIKAQKHDQSSEPESSSQSNNPNTTESTPTGFNRLTFDCLLLIFRRLPFQTLLPLRRLSRACNDVVIYICARKKRLILATYSPPAPLGKNEFDLFWIDDLSRYVMDRNENAHESVHFPINKLNKQCTIGLAQLFPSLTELRIHYDCHKLLQSCLTKIESILQQFSSPTLTVLSFILSANQTKPYSNGHLLTGLGRIFTSNITVGRFPHLKQLDLCIAGNYNSGPLEYSTIEINFDAKSYDNILGQLERFSLGYNSRNYSTIDALVKLGPNLLSLGLDSKDIENDYSFLKHVKFESLTHLRLNIIQQKQLNRNFIQAICNLYQTLTFIQFQIGHGTCRAFDDQWIVPLSTLKHLSELRLHNFTISHNRNSLPRVKKLTLCNRNLNVANGFCRSLTTQFPNLEELVLVSRPFVGKDEQTRAQEAMQLVRQHFAHLPMGTCTTVCDFTAPEWSE